MKVLFTPLLTRGPSVFGNQAAPRCLRGFFLRSIYCFACGLQPWTKKLFSTHHLWFIPFTTYINLKYAAGHSPCCLPVSMALSLTCVLASRCCTPYALAHGASALARKKALNEMRTEGNNSHKEKCGGATMEVLNVNLSWRCWADVAHHIPILGLFDGAPWYMYVIWNQLIWGLGNCFLFGIFLTAANRFRINY